MYLDDSDRRIQGRVVRTFRHMLPSSRHSPKGGSPIMLRRHDRCLRAEYIYRENSFFNDEGGRPITGTPPLCSALESIRLKI